MNFGREDEDSDHGQNERNQQKHRASKLISIYNAGCIGIVTIVFYLISHYGGDLVSTCIVLVSTSVWYIFIHKKERTRTDHELNLEKKLAKLQKENDKYRQQISRTFEELSPLKTLNTDNENLKSQIKRQSHTSYELVNEISNLTMKLKVAEQEKIRYAEDLDNEKEKSRRERVSMQTKMEEEFKRYNEKIKQLNDEIFQRTMKNSEQKEMLNTTKNETMFLNKKINELTENLKTTQNDRNWIENEAQTAILKERGIVEHFRQRLMTTEKNCTDIETELKKYKDKLKRLQEAEINTRASERARLAEEINELKSVNELLKIQLNQSSSDGEGQVPVCNICEDRPRNTYIDPCGHTLCMVCANEVQARNNKCPVCRKRINKIGQLYFS